MTGSIKMAPLTEDGRAVRDAISTTIGTLRAMGTSVHGSHGERLTLLSLVVDGPARLGDVADRVGLSRAAMTTVADRLERRGYARRLPSEEDRRVHRLSATPAAVAITMQALDEAAGTASPQPSN